MDVEQTIEFILHSQAKSEARADQFDKRLDAMRKLVETGMKMLVKIEKNQLDLQKGFAESKNDFDRRFKELVEAQKKTDQKLDRLIDSWTKRGSNGRRH
jgi:dsDNA-binding SOS-regulon protein